MKEYKIETNHIPCFALALHNNVTNGIEKFKDSNKLKIKTEKISAKFSRSNQLKMFLNKKQ